MSARDELAATIYAYTPLMKVVQDGHALADVIIAAGWVSEDEGIKVKVATVLSQMLRKVNPERLRSTNPVAVELWNRVYTAAGLTHDDVRWKPILSPSLADMLDGLGKPDRIMREHEARHAQPEDRDATFTADDATLRVTSLVPIRRGCDGPTWTGEGNAEYLVPPLDGRGSE